MKLNKHLAFASVLILGTGLSLSACKKDNAADNPPTEQVAPPAEGAAPTESMPTEAAPAEGGTDTQSPPSE